MILSIKISLVVNKQFEQACKAIIETEFVPWGNNDVMNDCLLMYTQFKQLRKRSFSSGRT